MKTVFIFGAGASKDAGAPLMGNFINRSRDIFKSRNLTRTEANDAFQDVFNAQSELRTVYDKSYLDVENIETLFGAIEMAQIIGKFGQRDYASIVRLRESIVSLIVRTHPETG